MLVLFSIISPRSVVSFYHIRNTISDLIDFLILNKNIFKIIDFMFMLYIIVHVLRGANPNLWTTYRFSVIELEHLPYKMVPFRIKSGRIFPEPWVPVDTVDWKGDVRTFGNSVFFNHNIPFCKSMSPEIAILVYAVFVLLEC